MFIILSVLELLACLTGLGFWRFEMLKRIHGSNSAALTYMQKAVNLYRLEFGIPVGFFISFSIEMMHCFYDHLIGK